MAARINLPLKINIQGEISAKGNQHVVLVLAGVWRARC